MNSISSLSTTPELIARQIRQAILRGEIRSREPLRQDKLASAFGVSKVPVREALAQLKAEGLVTYKTNRGAFVTGLSADEAKEIYLMRIALETIALQHAIPQLTKKDVVRAKNALSLIDIEDDPTEWAELNWEFHAIIYRRANMPHLLSTLETLHANVARYLTLYLDKMAFQTQSQAEHRAILAACEAGNSVEAVSHLAAHLSSASKSLEAYLTSTTGD